jgi:hypothetical protein
MFVYMEQHGVREELERLRRKRELDDLLVLGGPANPYDRWR